MISIKPGDNIYEVEKIIKKRVKRGVLEYFVKWEQFPLNQATWEPYVNLTNVKYMIDDFEKRRLKKRKGKRRYYSIYREIKPWNFYKKQSNDINLMFQCDNQNKSEANNISNNTQDEDIANDQFQIKRKRRRRHLFDQTNPFLLEQKEKEKESESLKRYQLLSNNDHDKLQINNNNETQSNNQNKEGLTNITTIHYSEITILSIEAVKKINGSLYAVVNYLLEGKRNTSLIKTEEFYHHNSEFLLKYYESKIQFEKIINSA